MHKYTLGNIFRERRRGRGKTAGAGAKYGKTSDMGYTATNWYIIWISSIKNPILKGEIDAWADAKLSVAGTYDS